MPSGKQALSPERTNPSGEETSLRAVTGTRKMVAKNRDSTVDRRTLQRLKRGQLNVEARIDLHGMTQRQAYAALLNFIPAQRSYQRRLVLVVTGKGWNPMAETPEQSLGVLRQNVPRWLNTAPFAPHVAAYTDAHVRHGGSGALYVLLRRLRRSVDR
jgi:DNA-nicking Smr family endonuclease